MTTVHHSPPPGATPFAIYEDPEDQEPPSPSEVYDGDVSFHSEISLPDADDAMPSIEHEHDHEQGHAHEHEPLDGALLHRYSSSYTSRPSFSTSQSSRRTSGVTSTSYVSSLPSEISVNSKPAPPTNNLDPRYTPHKDRPPFRNPSSVRAMQMSSPLPLPAIEASRERLKGQYKLATPSRSGRSDSMSTTSSRRPRSHRESMQRDALAVESLRHTPTPQQLPLVLLHVTILPMQMPYSHETMVRVMPEWLVENYKILEEKLQDIILMRRGLLIPHPRDEYEVLEERILESLELKVPRLLKCGHFVTPDEDSLNEKDGYQESVGDDTLERRSSMSGGTMTAEEEGDWQYQSPLADEESMCADCYRPVKKPGKGIGAGTKRWDLKIYAANGLMRAGAWLAAWSEMESCDVEIAPWIPEDVRKALEKRLAEEQEAARNKQLYTAELQRRIEEEAKTQRELEREADIKRRAEEIEVQRRIEAEAAALHRKLEEEAAEKTRIENSLFEKIEEAKETMRLQFEAQARTEADSVAERLRAMEEILKKEQERTAAVSTPAASEDLPIERYIQPEPQRRTVEVPLDTLLQNYILLLLRDSKNFLLVILTAMVVYLAMNTNGEQYGSWSLTRFPGPRADHSVPPLVITSTATMTATSMATLTVTALPTILSEQQPSEAILPPSILPSVMSPIQETMSVVASPASELVHDVSTATEASALPIEASTSSTELSAPSPETSLSSSASEETVVVPSSTAELEEIAKPSTTAAPATATAVLEEELPAEASSSTEAVDSSDPSTSQAFVTPSAVSEATQPEISSIPDEFLEQQEEPLPLSEVEEIPIESTVLSSVLPLPSEIPSEIPLDVDALSEPAIDEDGDFQEIKNEEDHETIGLHEEEQRAQEIEEEKDAEEEKEEKDEIISEQTEPDTRDEL